MLKNIKFRFKIVLMPILAVCAFLIILMVTGIFTQKNEALFLQINNVYGPAWELSRDLETLLAAIQRDMQDAVATEDEEMLTNADQLQVQFLKRVSDGQKKLNLNGFSLIYVTFQDYYSLARETTRSMIRRDNTAESLVQALESMTFKYNRIKDQLEKNTLHSKSSMNDAFMKTTRNNRITLITISLTIILCAVTLIIISIFISRSITKPVSDLVTAANDFSLGKKDTQIQVDSTDEIGELGTAFNEMMIKIQKSTTEIERQNWLMTGLAELNDEMRGLVEPRAFGQAIISFLANYLDVQVGAIYFSDKNEKFQLMGSFALNSPDSFKNSFRLGEGLLGQAASEKREIHITEVPKEFIKIQSGIGEAYPRSILIKPLFVEEVEGVIELGSFDEFSPEKLHFIHQSTEKISLAIHTFKSRKRLEELLSTTQDQAKQLQKGEIELRYGNRLLEEKTKRLEQSNKELEEFAHITSHDLQEPLRKIQVYCDRLLSSCADANSDGHKYLERVKNSATRMRTLINDLLTFSRVTRGERRFKPVNLEHLTLETISELEVPIQETNALVDVTKLLTIDCDPIQMRQLIQNLLSNALKFHKKGAQPEIKVSGNLLSEKEKKNSGINHTQEFYQLSISDNGIGFDERYLDRIFAVFQRLHGRGKFEGTGIGLSLCRKIVNYHGGKITAKSSPGNGSTFFVMLPVNQNDEGVQR